MKTLLLLATLVYITFSAAGQTWQQLTLPTTQDIVSSSFINDNEGWIGLENASSSITLYHTADGGTSWNPVSISGLQPANSYVCFLSALKGFVVVNGKAFKTTNGGTSWTQLSLPGTPYYKPYFFNENTGYISGKGEVYKTIDGGESWIAYPIEYEVILWDIHFKNDSIGYASEYDGYHYSTSNGGESWEYADDDGLWDYFFAVEYHPDGYLTYTGYEDFLGEFTSYIKGAGYSSEDIDKLFDLKWFNSNRGYAVGEYGWVVNTDNGGLVWNELVVADLFGLNDYNLNQIDGFNDVYVFGDHGTAFKLPGYCIAAPAFSFSVSEGDVEFTDQSVNASSWFWDFGDGTTSTLQNPSHTYPNPGTYLVCLTSSMDGCLSDVVCHPIITCKPNESLSTSGTIDESFGEHGFAIVNSGAFTDVFHTVLVQPDDKILAGGDIGLCRFLTNGSPDSTFDNDGKLMDGTFNDFALTADGKIVVGRRNSDDFELARYNADGTVDSSFGTNGKVTTDFSQTGEYDFVTALLIQPDQKILVLGYYDSSPDKTIVARYLADGLLDNSFAGDGLLTISIPSFVPGDLALQPDGKILIGGETESVDFIIKRYNENGSPDLTFGNNGFTSINFPPTYSELLKLLIQNDGKIIVAGNVESDFTIVRFDSQGTLDLSFGNNGVFSMQVYSSDDKPTSAILQPDGKILMTGYLQKYPDYDEIILLRITGEGKVDSSFGNYGIVTTLVNCDDSYSFSIALDDNYIYAGGGRHIYDSGESCLVRYLNGCEVPQELEVENIAPTMVAVDWEDAAGAASYKLRYKVSGTGAWTKTSAQPSGKKIYGLLPNTKYTLQVKSVCSNSANAAEWSEKLQFTTPPQKLGEELLSTISLEVYPNPLADVATVQFSITQSGPLEIALFDLQGNKIKIIAEGNFSTGNHSISIDASSIAKGIYLLRMISVNGIQNQKLIVQ